MVNITRGGSNRSALVPYNLSAAEQLRNNRNNFLVNGSTHALPPVSNGNDFAFSVLPNETATVTGIGLIDNSGNSTVKIALYYWNSGTAAKYAE